ncbi:uncharacterized protein PG986_002645 [Apiospora aurea]|uniref:F-box domain-containing protein n=1 Tax=Apiospora aurea TaxID=335848 RepID=A0ABR1QPF5_9PEZI
MANNYTIPFLSLPPELRNMIYYLALGDLKISYGPTTCTALAPPALTQTNRQARAETLSLYYSQNSFHFALPLPGGPSAFERWCAAMAPHFPLITRCISFTHAKMAEPRHWRAKPFDYQVGFELSSERGPDDPRRVGGGGGHDEGALDVNDTYTLSRACFRMLLAQAGPFCYMAGRKAAVDAVVKALCAVAPLCTRVNSRIYFSWSMPYLSRPAFAR